MHMADALLSPAVGATMWAGTAAVTGFAAQRLKRQIDDRTVPLMGVLGAFIFASQMINFTIPGTGSSGHLSGGMILAVLLGPHAAFLVMASVLTVQALFFADGGLLALGCNIWNLGVYPCYLVYPFVYRPLAGSGRRSGRAVAAAVVGAVAALQLGALSVVLQTFVSGKSELPFGAFLLLMQPIHLAIGIVEGLVTAGVINYVRNARPEVLESAARSRPLDRTVPLKKVLATFAAVAVITGGIFSWFASSHPDGLEWSIEQVTGGGLAEATHGVGALLKRVQEKTALLPDYTLPAEKGPDTEAAWPAVDGGTTAAGIIGATIVLGVVLLVGAGIRSLRGRS